MADKWFYRVFGEEFGPIPEIKLKELFELGTVGPSDEVRRDGSLSWAAAGTAFQESSLESSTATAVATTGDDAADDIPEWFMQVAGTELGPMSFNELLKLARNGELSAEDQLRFGDSNKWRRAGSIGRLVAELPYQDATPAPTPRSPTKATNGSASQPYQSPASARESAPSAPPPRVSSGAPKYQPAAFEIAWHAWIQGREYGPFSLVQLDQWMRSGQLSASDVVKYGPTGAWTPSSIIQQMLDQYTIAAPAPVAAPMPVAPAPAPEVAALPPAAAPSAASALPPVKLPPPPSPSSAAGSRGDSIETPKPTPRPAPPERKEEPAPSSSPSSSVAAAAAAMSAYSRPSSSASSSDAKPKWTPPARKPTPKRSSSSGGGMSIDLGPLKDPKIIGGIVAAALVVGFFFLPKGTGAEKAKFEQLKTILVDFRALRDKKGSPTDWDNFVKKSTETSKTVLASIGSASAAEPTKQNLMWAAKKIPEMLTKGQTQPCAAEIEVERDLFAASKGLKLEMEPPGKVQLASAKTKKSATGKKTAAEMDD